MILHPNDEVRPSVQVAKFDRFEWGLASQIKLTSSHFEDEFFGLVYTYRGRDTKKVLKAVWQHINLIPKQFGQPAWGILIVFNNQNDLDFFVEEIESNRSWPFNLQLILREEVVWTTRLP